MGHDDTPNNILLSYFSNGLHHVENLGEDAFEKDEKWHNLTVYWLGRRNMVTSLRLSRAFSNLQQDVLHNLPCVFRVRFSPADDGDGTSRRSNTAHDQYRFFFCVAHSMLGPGKSLYPASLISSRANSKMMNRTLLGHLRVPNISFIEETDYLNDMLDSYPL